MSWGDRAPRTPVRDEGPTTVWAPALLGVASPRLVSPAARVLGSYHLDRWVWVVAETWGAPETARVLPFQETEPNLDE